MKELFKNCKGSKQQGNIGHLLAMSYYASLGWNLSNPITDSNDYDFIAEDLDGNLLKIQAKTTRFKSDSGNYIVCLSTSGGNQREYWRKELNSSIDYIFVVTEEGVCYSIPTYSLDSRNSLTLYDKYEPYKVMVISTDAKDVSQGDLIIERKIKEIHVKEYFCPECGARVSRSGVLCKECSRKNLSIKQRKIERPSKEVLLKQLSTSSISEVGKFYGVSRSSIRRWLQDYDLSGSKKVLKNEGLI